MIFILSSCGQKKKNEIKIFLQQLQIDQIKNTYEISEGVYSVFLSDHTPFIYYTYTTVEYIVIVVREERSFAYLLDDTSYNDIRHMYDSIEPITHYIFIMIPSFSKLQF